MKNRDACTESAYSHYIHLLAMLTSMGFKADDTCAGTYQAFVELAEFLRVVNGHAPYTSTFASGQAEEFLKQTNELETRVAAGEDKIMVLRDIATKAGYTPEQVDLIFPKPQPIQMTTEQGNNFDMLFRSAKRDGRFDD